MGAELQEQQSGLDHLAVAGLARYHELGDRVRDEGMEALTFEEKVEFLYLLQELSEALQRLEARIEQNLREQGREDLIPPREGREGAGVPTATDPMELPGFHPRWIASDAQLATVFEHVGEWATSRGHRHRIARQQVVTRIGTSREAKPVGRRVRARTGTSTSRGDPPDSDSDPEPPRAAPLGAGRSNLLAARLPALLTGGRRCAAV